MDNWHIWNQWHLAGHTVSISLIVGTLAGWFGPIAGLAALIWYLLQIWSDPVVKGWRQRHRENRLLKLRRKIEDLERRSKRLG
jgi:hypothetical protein